MLRAILILLLAGGLGVLGWQYTQRPDVEGPTYRLAPITRGDVLVLVSATGTINPVTSVQVGSQVSGIISKLHADFNTKVTANMLLAEIDPSTFQAQVLQAKANLEKARSAELTAKANRLREQANLEISKAEIIVAQANLARSKAEADVQAKNLQRQRPLAADRLLASSELDKTVALAAQAVAQQDASEAQLATARAKQAAAEAQLGSSEAAVNSAGADIRQRQAELEIAEINLSRTKIVSPVDGVVVTRSVDVGQTVAASLSAPTLFVIAKDLTRMQINTSIDEADIGKIAEGQEVKFTVDAFTDRSFNGKVSQVRLGPVVNQSVVTYDCVVSVDNPDLKLLPGMTASASILVARADDVLRVPAAALTFKPEADEPKPQASASAGGRGRVRDRSRLFARGGGEQRPQIHVLGPNKTPVPVPVKTGLSDGRMVEVSDPAVEVVTGRTGAGMEGMTAPPSASPSPATTAAAGGDEPPHERRRRGEGRGEWGGRGEGRRRRRDASAAPDAPPGAPVKLAEGLEVVIGTEQAEKPKSALGGGNPFQTGGRGPRGMGGGGGRR